MSSIRQAQDRFRAEGREIPKAQPIKATWLDKIYGQNHPFTSYLLGKSKVWGISPFSRNDMPEQLQRQLKYRRSHGEATHSAVSRRRSFFERR